MLRIQSIMGCVAAVLPAAILAGAIPGWAATGATGTPTRGPVVPAGHAITLDDAIRFTREGNLDLRAAGLASDAARVRTRDAGRVPNPSLAAALENVGGSLGTGRAETSLLLEQSLELGGDRSARAGLAGAMATLSQTQQEELGRALEAGTVERFCDAWVLQERVKRLREAENVAARTVEAAESRLKAGAAPAFELTRALGFRSLREIERRRAEAEHEVARRSLALQWGADVAAFDSLLLPEPAPPALPPLDELYPRLEAHPSRRRAAAESTAESWRLREARAARVPNLQLAAGVRHLAEAEGTGLAVGVSLPLRLWNPLRWTVAAAESEHVAATVREMQTALEVRAELKSASERYVNAVSTWEGVRDRVRPAAQEAMRLIISGYRSGRLGYLDVQEGQRSLLEADVLLIEASAGVWRTERAIERLVGARLDELEPGKEGR